MKKTLIINMLSPLLTRVGTATGSALTAIGVAEPQIDLIVAAIPAVCGVLLDLVLRRMVK